MVSGRPPGLAVERSLQAAGFGTVGGIDEVGRGALSGPVTVGLVVVDAATGRIPRGLRDSKLLTPEQRRRLVPRVQDWAVATAVGSATAAEIDDIGLTAALRLAVHRALALVAPAPECLLLDGSHDYITEPEGVLPLDVGPAAAPAPPVETRVRADLRCAAVAAASVLAKVHRDSEMVAHARHFPGYGWEENKGYATPAHRDAVRRLGPTALHRRTWRL